MQHLPYTLLEIKGIVAYFVAILIEMIIVMLIAKYAVPMYI